MYTQGGRRETEAIRIMVSKTQDIVLSDMIRMVWEATLCLCSSFSTHKHAQLRDIFIITAHAVDGLSDTITPSACQSQPDTRNASYSRPQLMLLTGETENS